MATTLKKAALNEIINEICNFKIDCKSEIKLHLVKQTDKTDNLKEWVPLEI